MSQALQGGPDGPPINTIGSPFIELQSVDSTNNYARRQIYESLAQHGLAIFAHEQVAGKGQRGREWTSEKGKNIALSLLIKPHPLTVDQQFQLSACAAVAAHAFFMKYGIEKVTIKWPNDLYWQDRKAGGILIENLLSSQEQSGSSWNWAIAGIGVNINQTQFPSDLPNPVSLKQITGKDHDPIQLAKAIVNRINLYYQELLTTGPENIFSQYNRYLYKQGQRVKLKKDNRVFEALIKYVNAKGQLETTHAIPETFDFGSIEWVV